MALARHGFSREALVGRLFFLPAPRRSRLNRWLDGRHEFRKLGRLRVRRRLLPQERPDLAQDRAEPILSDQIWPRRRELLGSTDYHRKNPAIPTVLFTHDNYLADYTGDRASKAAYYDKKVLLLLRDPRDVAMSWYHTRRYRPNPLKAHVGVFEVSA